MTGAIGTLQEVILHTPGLHKKITFCNCLYLRLETTFFSSFKAQNNYSLCTGAVGTLQCGILHPPRLHKSYTKKLLFAFAYISG